MTFIIFLKTDIIQVFQNFSLRNSVYCRLLVQCYFFNYFVHVFVAVVQVKV